MANEQQLLQFNLNRALSNLLSAEEHATISTAQGDRDVAHSWCIKKHSTLASDHHLFEAIQISEKNPSLRNELVRVKKHLDDVRRNPTPNNLRDVRNELRSVMKDPTLKCNGVCAYDSKKDLKTTSAYSLSSGSTHTNPEDEDKSMDGDYMAEATTYIAVLAGALAGKGTAILGSWWDRKAAIDGSDGTLKDDATTTLKEVEQFYHGDLKDSKGATIKASTRRSTWVNAGVGIGGFALAYYGNKVGLSSTMRLGAAVLGAVALSNLLDLLVRSNQDYSGKYVYAQMPRPSVMATMRSATPEAGSLTRIY